MVLASTQATAAIIDGVRQKPVPKTIDFATRAEVYLYNVGAQAFFTQGDAWGTKGIVGQDPRKIVFEDQSEGKYIFYCYCWRDADQQGGYMAANWRAVFFDSETAIFVDRNSQPNYFWDVELNGDGTFRVLTSTANPDINPYNYPGMYLGIDVTGNPSNSILSPLLEPGTGHYIDWVMVNQEDFPAYEEALKVYNTAQELKGIIGDVEALGGDASTVEAVYLNEEASLEELEAAIKEAKKMYIQALIDNAEDRDNIDVTMLLNNPDFEQGEEGWTVIAASGNGPNGRQGNVRPGGSASNQCYEAWNNPEFDIYQVVEDAPVGVYEIEVQGFYRYGRGNEAWNAYVNQSVDYVKPKGVPVYVYMNNNATNFVNVYGDPKQIKDETFYSNGSSDYASQVATDGTRYYFPDGMASAAIAFSADMYKQSAFGLVARNGDVLRLGVKGNSNQLNDSWVIWDNFNLVYRGFKPDVIKPVLEEEIVKVNSTYMGLLMGKTEYAAFTDALAAAEEAIKNNDGEGMFNALNALYDAKDPALVSKDIFLEQDVAADTLRLAEAIRQVADKKLSTATQDYAATLFDNIKGNLVYENGEIDQLKNDVTEAIYALWESVELYEQLAEAIGRLAEAKDYLETSFSQLANKPEAIIAQAQQTLEEYTELYGTGAINDNEMPATIEAIDELATNLRAVVDNYIIPSDWALLKAAWQQMDNGDGWKQNWNFDTETPSLAFIPGVTATNGNVTAIDLSNNNLSGAFPYAFFDLPYLESLNVSYNELSGDIGQGMADYIVQHPDAGKSLKSLNINSNQLEGNIGRMASLLPSISDLDAGWNRLSEVAPMIDKNVNVNLRGQALNRELNLTLKGMTAASIAAQLPPIALYNHYQQTFGPDMRLHVSSSDYYYHMYLYLTGMEYDEKDGNGSFSGGNISISGTGNYIGLSGDLLDGDTGGQYDTPWDCAFTARLTFDQGDGNFDGDMNILDLQSMILYIMENLGYQPYNFTASNLWQDDQINIQDIICLINLLMSDEQESAGARRNAPNSETTYDASMCVQDGQLILNTCKPVAAMDLRISGANSINVSKDLERIGMSFVTKNQADGLHVIVYSMNGACIPSGTSIIGTFDSNISTVKHVMLSDSYAKVISVTNSGSLTGIEGFNIMPISQSDNCVYDVQGRKVSNSHISKGLYIKNGHKIIK